MPGLGRAPLRSSPRRCRTSKVGGGNLIPGFSPSAATWGARFSGRRPDSLGERFVPARRSPRSITSPTHPPTPPPPPLPGIFLHQPFPSSEIFRSLSHREELLRGVLCADHIGFHLYEWARNFLASCRRLLAVTFEARRGGGLTVSYNGRSIAVTITHMGVEPSLLLQKLPAPAVVRAAQKLRAAFGNAAVISFRRHARTAGLKGVPLKLLAFEHFLHLHPHRAGSVVLALYGIVPDARPDDVHACRREVTALVARINGRFPRAVYFHELRSLPLVERIALWQARVAPCHHRPPPPRSTSTAHRSPLHHITPHLRLLIPWQATDLLFVSSVREGLNLMPFEYLLAREGNPGALLLSEFSSVARVLSGAVTTNPFSIKKVGLAIETALSLPPDERARRAAADLASTRLDSTSAWARRVLLDVTRAARPAGAEGRGSAAGMGLGSGWRAAGSGTGQLATGMAHAASCCALRRDHLLTTYRATSRRLILLADAGVLRPSPAAADGHGDAGADGLPDPPTPPGRSPRPPGLSPSLDTLPRLPLLPPSEAERPRRRPARAGADAAVGGRRVGLVAGGLPAVARPRPRPRVVDDAERRRREFEPQRRPRLTDVAVGGGALGPSRHLRRPSNTVAVLTSGSREAAAAAYGGVGGCSLVSDGGLHLAWAPSPQKPAEVGWELTAAAQAAPVDGWQELALSICEAYAQRTNGAAAYADAATGAVRFDFGLADVEFGAMQARELNNHLADALGGHDLDVDLGASSLVVRPRGVDKGGAARQLLALCSAGARRPIDFVLALGVGAADEPMFTAVEEWRAALPRGSSLDVGGPHVHACVVGRTPSKAAQFVEDQPSAAALLDALKWGSMRASKSFSFDAGGGEAPLDGGGGAHDGGGMATLPARPRRLSDSPNLGSGIRRNRPRRRRRRQRRCQRRRGDGAAAARAPRCRWRTLPGLERADVGGVVGVVARLEQDPRRPRRRRRRRPPPRRRRRRRRRRPPRRRRRRRRRRRSSRRPHAGRGLAA